MTSRFGGQNVKLMFMSEQLVVQFTLCLVSGFHVVMEKIFHRFQQCVIRFSVFGLMPGFFWGLADCRQEI